MVRYTPRVLSALLTMLGLVLVVSCAPTGLSDKDDALIKGVSANTTQLRGSVQAQDKTIAAQAAQIAALQKEITALKAQTATLGGYATKVELSGVSASVAQLATGGSMADLQKRVAVVEGENQMRKSEITAIQRDVINRLTIMSGTISNLDVVYTSGGTVRGQIQTLQTQVADLTARLVSHGW